MPNEKGKVQERKERMNRRPHSTSKLRFEVNDVQPLCTVIDATTNESHFCRDRVSPYKTGQELYGIKLSSSLLFYYSFTKRMSVSLLFSVLFFFPLL